MATLNLHNPEGLYSGGSVSVNALPYARLAMEARARNQAREGALDKYYNQLPDTINDKGVRDVEVPVINEYKKKIFEYGVKNRDALKKGDGAAKLGLDQLFREAQSVARLSQNAAKNDLEAGKFFLEKNNQFALNNDEYIKDHQRSLLPVNHPDYKALDLQKYATDRPFNEAAFTKDIKAKIPYSEKVVREVDKTDPNYEIVTTLPVLNEKAKAMMVSDAADRIHTDPVFKKKIQTDLAGTGQLQGLVQIAQEQFGLKDPTEITDELLAAAYTYSKLPIGVTKEKVQANYTNREAGKMADWKIKDTAKNAEWDRRNQKTFGQSLTKIAANKTPAEQQTGTTGNALDEFGVVTDLSLQSGGKISKGLVYDKSGNAYNGELAVKKEWLPANVTVSLSAAKIPLKNVMNVKVKDGVIQSIMTPNGEVSRQAMENLQKKANTEPIKAPQPVFGNPTKKVEQPAPKKETPSNKPAAKPKKDPLNLGF